MIKIYFDEELINSDYYAGLTRSADLYSDKFKLGGTLCESYKFTIDKSQLTEKQPSAVYIYNDDEIEKTLYIDSYTENDFTITYDLVDAMVNFNFSYDASTIMTNGKTTLGAIFQDIASKGNLSTDISTFDFYNMEISWYDNSITARSYLSFIGEINSSYFYITSDNKLAMSSVKKDSKLTLNFDDIGNYKIGQYHKITRVVWDDGLNHWEAGDESGNTYYINTSNVYVTSQEVVNNIYNKIVDFEFYDFEVDNLPSFAKSKNLFDYKSASNLDNTFVSAYRLFKIKNLKPSTRYNFNNINITSMTNPDRWLYLWKEPAYGRPGDVRIADKNEAPGIKKVNFTSNDEGEMYLAIYPSSTSVWESLMPYLEYAQIEEGTTQTDYESFHEAIQAGDIITFTDGTNEYPVIVQFPELNLSGNDWFGGISLQLETTRQEETEIIGVEKQIKSIKNIVDRDSNTITTLIEQTDSIQSNLKDNYYTLDQVNQLVQSSATGITNIFSSSGGNNIFRNTGLWFSTTDQNNPYEYWTGIASWVSESRAVNSRAILLKNGSFIQQQSVPNGTYAVSFKYEKDIVLSNVKVIINDTEYTLTGNEFETIIQVSSQVIKVEFVCDIDNGCRIYDLMVNAGEVKLAYTQNQNETTTDTVNISKGITITSSDYDVTFKANADGIRTVDRNNTILTEFTDKGLITEEAEIKGKSKIVGLLYQEVGEQTWITKL